MTLHKEDIINSIQYIMRLRGNEGEVDDIDHLGNRRVRTIEELAGEELRKGNVAVGIFVAAIFLSVAIIVGGALN
mgnify:CR=1 FL=1